MLGRAKEIGGFKNGDYSVASGCSTYYGGSPAKMTSGGTLDLATSGDAAYVGIFANSKIVDFRGESVATTPVTVYVGSCAVRLTSGTRDNGLADGLPYKADDTWVAGDLVYVSATGQWTNTQPGSAAARGVVMAVGADYLDVWFGV